jgi:hypothetical protein
VEREGLLAEQDGKMDEAIKDIRKEQDLHPDETTA